MNKKLEEKLSKHNLYVGKDGNVYLKKKSNNIIHTCVRCDLVDAKCCLAQKVGFIICGSHDYFKLVHKDGMEGV